MGTRVGLGAAGVPAFFGGPAGSGAAVLLLGRGPGCPRGPNGPCQASSSTGASCFVAVYCRHGLPPLETATRTAREATYVLPGGSHAQWVCVGVSKLKEKLNPATYIGLSPRVLRVPPVPLLWTGVPTSGRQALLRMFPCPGSTTTTTCRVFHLSVFKPGGCPLLVREGTRSRSAGCGAHW